MKINLKKSLKVKPEERIGKFNLFLIGSITLIAVFSIGQIITQKIIQEGKKNNLPEISTGVFVDQNGAAKKETGSNQEPFKTILKALEAAEENPEIKDIFIFAGEYPGEFELPQDINLYGEPGETLINNKSLDGKTLVLKGNNTIQGLGIQGGRYAVHIPEEAKTIKIKNCQIKNASWYGIYNKKHPEANEEYSLEVTDSEISGNYKQGLYLQKGNFLMKNSKSINNSEEGVDLHLDMNSTIIDSEISNNGEGGIETELGNMTLTVQGCLIENNGSSGINLQSDSDGAVVKIENNSVNDNRAFGIRCALHSKTPGLYFSKALQPFPDKTNSFTGNRTSIDPNCWNR